MNDTSRELGGALGVAVLGSVLTTRYGSALAPAVADLPEQASVGGDVGPRRRPAGGRRPAAPGGEGLADAARQAFLDGFGVAALVAAALVLLSAVAAARLLPRQDPVQPAATAPMDGVPADTVPADAVPADGVRVGAQSVVDRGDHAGSRPASPTTRSSSGASSETGDDGAEQPRPAVLLTRPRELRHEPVDGLERRLVDVEHLTAGPGDVPAVEHQLVQRHEAGHLARELEPAGGGHPRPGLGLVPGGGEGARGRS